MMTERVKMAGGVGGYRGMAHRAYVAPQRRRRVGACGIGVIEISSIGVTIIVTAINGLQRLREYRHGVTVKGSGAERTRP